MSKGNRLRSKRDRNDFDRNRMTKTIQFFAKKMNEPVSAERAAADEHSKLSQELDKRPCGGTDHCVTKNGTRASHPHVGCQK